MPTYNPTEHLAGTLLAARTSLAACGASGQIEIVDDASPAVDVAALLSRWGLDAIPVHRRPLNGGLGECWNACIRQSRGELIHILHQDDLIKPSFYSEMTRLATTHPQAGMLFCRTEFIDGKTSSLERLEQPDEGLITGWLEKIASGQRLQCPSVVVRRHVYERVGLFEPSLRYVTDWEMWVRIAACTAVAYLPQPLAIYRIHAFAETRRIKAAGATTADYAAGLRLVTKTLTNAGRSDCIASAEAFVVNASIYAAQEAEAAQNPGVAAKEVYASMRYLGDAMAWRRLYRQLRWYLRLRISALLA